MPARIVLQNDITLEVGESSKFGFAAQWRRLIMEIKEISTA